MFLVLLVTTAAFAEDPIPPCPDLDGSALPVMNEPVAQWKHTQPNQWRHRARLQGYVDMIYRDRNGHQHFGMQIDRNNADAIEVIYNEDFGPLPELHAGMRIEACGDFIVSTRPSHNYPASPLGAIIHWVHMNPDNRGHPPGYLWIEGTLCGQDPTHAGPKRHHE
jgi:hypothetical protein